MAPKRHDSADDERDATPSLAPPPQESQSQILLDTITTLSARLTQLEAAQAPPQAPPMPRRSLATTFGKLVSPGPFALPYVPNPEGNVTRTYTKLNTSKQPTGFVRCNPNDPPEGLKGIKPADVPTFKGTDFPEFVKSFFNFMASYDPLLAEALLADHTEDPTRAHTLSTQRQALQLLKSALQPYQPSADLLLLVDSSSPLPAADAWHLVHTQFTRGVLFSLGTHLRRCTTPQQPQETALAFIHRLLLAREHCHSILPNSVSDDLMAVLILTGLSSAYSTTTDKLYANHLDTIPYIDEIRTMILLNQGLDHQQENLANPAAGSPSVLTTQAPNTPKDPCFHCGNLGHWARNCPNPRDPAAFAKWKTDYLKRREAKVKSRQSNPEKPSVNLTEEPSESGNPIVALTSTPTNPTGAVSNPEYSYQDLFSPNPSVCMTTTYGTTAVGRDRTVRTPPAGALLDPGANVHAVADLDQLSHVRTISGSSIILEGISCTAHAAGLYCRTYHLDNGAIKTISVPAYYVPDLPSRTTAGYRVVISQSALERQYDAGLHLPRPSVGGPRVLNFPEGSLSLRIHSGLYFLPDGQPVSAPISDTSRFSAILRDMCSPCVVTTTSKSTGDPDRAALYHRRFGHASADSLRRQLAHFPDGLRYTLSDIDSLQFCDDCAVAKARMGPRNRGGGTKPSQIFQKLSTDLYGPVQGPADTPS